MMSSVYVYTWEGVSIVSYNETYNIDIGYNDM